MKKKTWMLLALAVVLVLLCALLLPRLLGRGESANPATEPDAPQIGGEAQGSGEEPPADKLFITVERQNYDSGELQLRIPKLSVDSAVYDGTSREMLLKGACLYEYAQLPGEGNRNVSIAAHRNGYRDNQPTWDLFYYLDTLTDGDYVYLYDSSHIYRYVYDSTTVVAQDDWGPIYSQGFSCVTLTTCTPIGVADHRLIVRCRLDEITDYRADYAFLASAVADPGESAGEG